MIVWCSKIRYVEMFCLTLCLSAPVVLEPPRAPIVTLFTPVSTGCQGNPTEPVRANQASCEAFSPPRGSCERRTEYEWENLCCWDTPSAACSQWEYDTKCCVVRATGSTFGTHGTDALTICRIRLVVGMGTSNLVSDYRERRRN